MYLSKPTKKYIRKIKTKLVNGYDITTPKSQLKVSRLDKNSFFIRKHRAKMMHTLFLRMMYKGFEGHQYYISHEKKYNEFVYDNSYFKRFKEAFLKYARRLIFRFRLKKEKKASLLRNPINAFGFYPYKRYRMYDQMISYYSNIFKKIKTNKSTLGFTSNYFSQILIDHYKGALFADPTLHINALSLKYGRFTSPTHNNLKYRKYKQLYKYNYIYFNVSVLRYLQYKFYLDKVIEVFYNLTLHRGIRRETFGFINQIIEYHLGQLNVKYSKLNHYVALSKLRLENHFREQTKKGFNNKKMLYAIARCRLRKMRQIYLSYLKSVMIKYFKINLHFKFTKTNIFITVTNYKGNVKYRHSIGLIGYKKDKKKTYYAAKELIKIAIPKLFDIFKIKNKAILSSISYIKTELFKMYIDMIDVKENKKELDLSLWNLKSRRKKPSNKELTDIEKEEKRRRKIRRIERGIRRIIGNTMKKFITLRIILRGSKSKLKGLMRRVFKELRKYKWYRNKYLIRVLFLALNTKPHNGCRSPKKGRRRTKRRKQRLRFKIVDKQKEFKQKMLKKQWYWRQRFRRGKKIKMPKHIYENPIKRRMKSINYLKRNRLSASSMSNIPIHLSSTPKHYFVYPKLRKRKRYYERRVPYKYRTWRDHERYENPFPIELKKPIKRKRIKKKALFYKVGYSISNSIS